MKTKKVFSLFLAMDLCELGHKIVALELNKSQNKQIYVFEFNDSFDKDFNELSKKHKLKTVPKNTRLYK